MGQMTSELHWDGIRRNESTMFGDKMVGCDGIARKKMSRVERTERMRLDGGEIEQGNK